MRIHGKNYTIQELRDRCQKTGPSLQTQSYFGRTVRLVSIYLTALLLKTTITPNQLTFLGTVIYLGGTFLFAFNNFYLSLTGIGLLIFSTIIDACDGEVFRFWGYKGGYGASYVEPISHDTMYAIMFFPIAFGAFQATENSGLLIFGAAASTFKILFRLAEQRFYYGVTQHLTSKGHVDPTKKFKEASFVHGIIYRLYRNIGTSTGVLTLLIVAVFIRHLDWYIMFYGTLYVLLWLGIFGRQLKRFRKISQQVLDRHAYLQEVKERVKKKKLIVFDLDGTLLDTMGIFADVASYVISAKHNIPRLESRKMYLQTSGIPFFEQLEVMFPGHEHNPGIAFEFESRKLAATDHIELTAEDRETLQALSDRGYRFLVSSNNFQENVNRFARFSGIPFIHLLGYREGFAKGREHFNYITQHEQVKPEEIIFVGDSLSDMHKAHQAGIDFVARLGTFNKDDFEREFSSVIYIRNLKELLDLL